MCYETSRDDVFLCFGNKECYENGALDIMPHSEFMDLFVVYRKKVEISDKTITMPLFVTDLEKMDVTEDTLFDMAKSNTERHEKPVLYSLASVVQNLTGGPKAHNLLEINGEIDDEGPGLYVLSNEENHWGAVMIMFDNVMNEVVKKLGGNFFILPSSVHEVIIVLDKGECSVEGLKSMVMEINRTTVDTVDKLSDSIYYYNCGERELRRIA